MMDKNGYLNAHFNNGFVYGLYGAMGLLAALFMWKLVPETEGKSIMEQEEKWANPASKTLEMPLKSDARPYARCSTGRPRTPTQRAVALS